MKPRDVRTEDDFDRLPVDGCFGGLEDIEFCEIVDWYNREQTDVSKI